MFSENSKYYRVYYQSFKNYEAEALKVREIISQHAPDAQKLLSVACGVGMHEKYLASQYDLTGMDLNASFIEECRSIIPNAQFEVANMLDFDLGAGEYDAVISLFSSIGYVETFENLCKAIAEMAKHLKEGGILLVEPWIEPKDFKIGKNGGNTVESENIVVSRHYSSTRDDDVSVIRFNYMISEEGRVSFHDEDHRLGLFSREQMMQAFSKAGLFLLEYVEGILSGRGLYVLQKQTQSK